jgi:hypothetical protein
MPSLFPMRHDDLESHRADRLFSPCRSVAQSQVYCVSFACLVRADNQGRRGCPPSGAILERLFGRRTDALTNFFRTSFFRTSGSFCATSRIRSRIPPPRGPDRLLPSPQDENSLRGKAVPANWATVACRKDMSGTNIGGKVRDSVPADDSTHKFGDLYVSHAARTARSSWQGSSHAPIQSRLPAL